MSITLNTIVFTGDVYPSPEKYQYLASNHTFSSTNKLTLARTAPKATATFAGVARSEVKRTKTVTLADSTTADAIVTVNMSLPVGMAEADADAIVNDVADFLLAAGANDLYWNHNLNVSV